MITDTQLAYLNEQIAKGDYTGAVWPGGEALTPATRWEDREKLGLELLESADGKYSLIRKPVAGRKDDSGKVRMELMADLPRAIEAVAEVMTWAVTKKQPVPYEPGSWLNVPDFQKRYRGALGRHLVKLDKGGTYARDEETGLLELAHLATNAMFKLERALRDQEEANGSRN